MNRLQQPSFTRQSDNEVKECQEWQWSWWWHQENESSLEWCKTNTRTRMMTITMQVGMNLKWKWRRWGWNLRQWNENNGARYNCLHELKVRDADPKFYSSWGHNTLRTMYHIKTKMKQVIKNLFLPNWTNEGKLHDQAVPAKNMNLSIVAQLVMSSCMQSTTQDHMIHGYVLHLCVSNTTICPVGSQECGGTWTKRSQTDRQTDR